MKSTHQHTRINAALAACFLGLLAGVSAVGDGIIRRKGATFVDKNCMEFMYSGWNSWELLEDSVYKSGEVESLFDTMRDAQLMVGRFFGHGHDTSIFQLQYSAGSYNEDGLAGLDRLLDAAGRRGLKLVVTLSDNWNEADGKMAYARWAGKSPHEFFTDEGIKQWFRNHIDFMANRVNSVNGKVYKDDDAIFSWNLMNEPRCDCDLSNFNFLCESGCTDSIQAWIEEMSAYVKSKDPNHLITVGEEGFYSQSSGRGWVNPPGQWAQHTGQDFIRNHSPGSIDYSGIHIWPDNWQVPNLEFQQQWVAEHISDAYGIGKPLVIEEFGKTANDDDNSRAYDRDPFYRNVYDTFSSQRSIGGPLKGVGFWEYGQNGYLSPLSISQHHSTWNDIVKAASQNLFAELGAKQPVGGCRAGSQRSFDVLTAGDTSYITAGWQMVAEDEGTDLSGQLYLGLQECADQCSLRSDCSAFSHLENNGLCSLKFGASSTVTWSYQGWQTYWKESSGQSNGMPEGNPL